jgi:prepilin-type N-terminal cleavage/methylation domain-containing protein
MNKKGFTMIELLVVIAIIGILVGIVLVSIGLARSKGVDAAIKQSMSSLRNQIALAMDSNLYALLDQSTTTVSGEVACGSLSFWTDEKVSDLIKAAGKIAGLANIGGTDYTTWCGGDSLGDWAVAVVLKTDPSKSWCVDSKGVSMQIDTPTGKDTDPGTLMGCQ